MSSREQILNSLKANSSKGAVLPKNTFNTEYLGDVVEKFKELIGILHGNVIEVKNTQEIADYIQAKYAGKRIVNNTKHSDFGFEEDWKSADPHSLEDIEFTLIETEIAVAENGAVWLTEEMMGQRVAPFICQQLGIIVKKDSIVPTMAQAYEKLGAPNSGFSAFIAGPSKTADIEQSLVTGAHGHRDIHVFLI